MSTEEKGTIDRRKSLTILQQTSDRENLAGRPKNLKHQHGQGTSTYVEVKRNQHNKETQTNFDTKISVDDLTNPDGASGTYWKILAEKRQIALQESLDENEKLYKIVEELKQENVQYKQMLNEANSFIEVIKGELEDDTGIDVNDISSTDITFSED